MPSRTLKTTDLARGIKAGDRATLARAITLIESKSADHRKSAHHLVQELLPLTGKAVRLGITGAPGAGKSTTIDVLGTTLTGAGHKVAVLAVDPSSSRTGGSILGAKTRIARLASDPNAFVRPSPTCSPPVVTYSALTGNGISELWSQVQAHKKLMTASGELAARRREQQVKWMWSMLEERLTARLRSDASVRGKLKAAEAAVAAGRLAPTLAVEEIAQLLGV